MLVSILMNPITNIINLRHKNSSIIPNERYLLNYKSKKITLPFTGIQCRHTLSLDAHMYAFGHWNYGYFSPFWTIALFFPWKPGTTSWVADSWYLLQGSAQMSDPPSLGLAFSISVKKLKPSLLGSEQRWAEFGCVWGGILTSDYPGSVLQSSLVKDAL
jgi:hypothetical protein